MVQDAANHPDVINSIAANACLLPSPNEQRNKFVLVSGTGRLCSGR
jgi:hypothetical protein